MPPHQTGQQQGGLHHTIHGQQGGDAAPSVAQSAVRGGATMLALPAAAAKPTQQVGHGAAAQPTATAMVLDGGNTTSTKDLQEAVLPASTIQGINADLPESSEQGTKKTKGKPYCYRCRTKGHTIHECFVALRCELCYGDHIVKACPHSKKTNTNVVLYGYVAEGLGFYFIPNIQTPKIDAQDKRAVVRVLEGSFTVDQVTVELERLRPEKNHNWDIRTVGADHDDSARECHPDRWWSRRLKP